MYWQEVPYRLGMLGRTVAQSKGFFTARRVPPDASDAAWGRPWCHPPKSADGCAELFSSADRILAGDLQVFDQPVTMKDGVPDWNADPVTGARIGRTFGPLIDFRHVGDGIDIKYLWEVNRHLWWLPLAQCYALTGRRVYLDRLELLLESWLMECPYALGANWSSPVEHGVRLINWSLVWHLVGGHASPMFEGDKGSRLRRNWLDSIFQHMRFVSDNYSRYSSANNHLVGEAAGVFVAGHTWDRWSSTRGLRTEAKAILEKEALRQFSEDGVNLEQATGYHKFCLQFLWSALLAARANADEFSDTFCARMRSASTFLAALTDSRGAVPAIGDSDDAEVWRFDGASAFEGFRFLLALAAIAFQQDAVCTKAIKVAHAHWDQVAWLLPDAARPIHRDSDASLPTRFVQGGYVILGSRLHELDEFRVVFDCGPLGINKIAGHGHADALSVLVSRCGYPLLVDSGTYCYNAAPELRRYFRGTRAHNSLVVDGVDQSVYGASFLWLRDVDVCIHDSDDPRVVHASHDGYTRLPDSVVHHRRLTLAGDGMGVLVEDWLRCEASHDVELLWHISPDASVRQVGNDWFVVSAGAAVRIRFGNDCRATLTRGQETPPQGWVSTRFYERIAAAVLSVRVRVEANALLTTEIRAVEPPAEDPLV